MSDDLSGYQDLKDRHTRGTRRANGAALARRFELVPFDRIEVGVSRACLIKGLIPREGLIVVWGPPKCGKSFWAFDVVAHVALGREYRGRRVEQGAVVYVACEGERGLAARVEAFRRAKMTSAQPSVPFYLVTTRLDLVAEVDELVAEIRAQLPGGACSAVVIDTLNRSIRGSESDDSDMSSYVKAADAIREGFRCAVMIIHHCGTDDRRPRGHTSLTGAADAQIAVKRNAAGQIVTTVEYMKDGPEGEETCSRLEVVQVGTDEDGERITSCVVESDDVTTDETRRANKATGAAKVALDLLRRVVTDHGEPAPTSNHIPPHARVTEIDLWRRHAYEGSVTDSDKPAAQRKAFMRAVTKLQELGLVGIWSKWAWLTDGGK